MPRMRTRRNSSVSKELEDYLTYCKDFQVDSYASVKITLNNTTLSKRIHIGKNFNKDGLLPLFEVLKYDKNIEVLDFRGAKIGSSGCIALENLLETNTSIKKIDLTGNNIDHYGAKHLASALQKNNTLEELILRSNLLAKKGAYNLAEGIKHNTSLRTLDLSNCYLGYLGSKEIEKAIGERKVDLNLAGNYVREEALNAISHFIGILFAVIGGYFMIDVARKHTWPYLIGCVIFVFALFLLMTCSVLAHSLHWMERTGRLFALLDHAMIAVFIAASYTPFLLVTLGHSWIGHIWMIVIWCIAVICIILSFAGPKYQKIELFMFLFMGWLSLLGIKYLLACVPTQGLILIGIGGLFYSIGVFFFVKGQTVPIYHAIWHLFVLSATIAHYFAVLFYVDHCEVVFH